MIVYQAPLNQEEQIVDSRELLERILLEFMKLNLYQSAQTDIEIKDRDVSLI